MHSHLRLAIDPHKPWILINETIDKQYCEGIQCDLLKYVSKSLNFTCEFVIESDGVGHELSNGSWKGYIARIVKDEADMTFSPFGIVERPFVANIVDYSIPYNVERAVVLSHIITEMKSNIFSYFCAFDKITWILIIVSLIGMTTLVSLLHKMILVKKDLNINIITELFLEFYASFLDRDVLSKNYFLITFPTLILSFWLMGLAFIKIFFSSELTAELGLKTPVKQIDTLLDSNIKLIVINSFLMHEPMHGINIRIYEKALKDGTNIRIQEFFEDDKWVEGVAYGENAIFLFEVPIHMIITKALRKLKEKCRFRYLPQDYGQKFYLTIASSKRLDVKFRHKLNLRISQYMTTGTIEYQLKNITKDSEKCFVHGFQTTSNEFRQLIFDDFEGAFVILLSGCTISLLFLINELLMRKILVLKMEIILLFSIWSAMKKYSKDF